MSYLENNMNLLKTSYPEVWEKISAVEKTLNQDLLQLIRNKKGMLNLRVGQMLIHDKNNPHQEAKAFIQSQKNIEEHSDILFYGIGLGYAIQAFNQEYPHKPFSVYEPIPEIFYHFLAHTDLAKFPRHILKKIYIETQPEDVEGFCSTYAKTIGYSGMLIEHPNYARIFPEKRQNFIKVFEKHIRERSASINTLSAFEKLWTSNSTKNMIEILNSPNILLKNKDHFLQQPAIMVASGPSLEDEIENLHKIKSEGLAYIFSVGTALNALIRNGIYPHAAFTYDPSEKNLIICKEVIEKGIDSIPLIFGSTVYHQTLAQYPGPKMHMLISQDTLAAYYLKPKNSDQIETIHDATTIAVITLQVLAKLGFSPIILVGQNLAYRDKKVYAANATFHPRERHAIIMGPRSGRMWDSLKIGAGTQPIKTRYGWLMIYHGVDRELVYRLGVILVDLNNPELLIYRSPNSILEPEEEYEIGSDNSSWVPNVVFTCGAIPALEKDILEDDDEILVYYGAADTHIAVATATLAELIPAEYRR
jgi:hypothetical protein